jgi:hypothetical protein
MNTRNRIGLAAQAAALAVALVMSTSDAESADEIKYPDMSGQWIRLGSGLWDATKPFGRGQQAPLTPEYQAIFEANLADQAAGGPGALPSWYCLPQGMPMMMMALDPMEVIVTPSTTYVLTSHVNDSYRRIFTDGRNWPGQAEPTYKGYSIGKWIDEDGDGKYDRLEVETRYLKPLRSYDSSGVPFHKDGETIIKERIYFDKDNQNMLHDEVTVLDHSLTRPWIVTRNYRRSTEPQPVWNEEACAEGNPLVRVGDDAFFMSSDGYLMPTKKGQAPPDLRYFKDRR